MKNDGTRRNRIQPLHLVDAEVAWEIGDELVNAVITAAVWSEGQKPGIWQKMIEALNRGGPKRRRALSTPFCFGRWWARLMEEFHAPGDASVE